MEITQQQGGMSGQECPIRETESRVHPMRTRLKHEEMKMSKGKIEIKIYSSLRRRGTQNAFQWLNNINISHFPS